MTNDEQDVLCEKLITNLEPILFDRASKLLRLLMKIFRKRLRNCNEEQFTQIVLEASALSCHVSNAEILEISEDELPDLQYIVSRMRRVH